MLKHDEKGDFFAVDNWEEHQQLMQQRQQEQADEQNVRQQNQQLQQHQPHQDRRRAGNQLEAIEDFNQNQHNMPPGNKFGTLSLSNAGLAESMVMVDPNEAE